jgi:PAS domain S-box-containing protein
VQRTRAEAARGESEDARAQLRTLMDTAPVAMLSCDAEGVLRFANPEAERIWGHPLMELPREEWGRYNLYTLDGERMPPERMGLARALRTPGTLIENEGIIERPDGRRFWFMARSQAVLRPDAGEKPEVLGAISAFLDVTHQREIEGERDRLLRALLLDRPDDPTAAPGLEFATYYAAAQTEVRVGGDFYDVFPLGDDRTALVVGDMSGKGVPAAAQVAMVRNMLRFALYRGQSLGDALDELNAVLTERRLLTGFATLFVGVYDPGAMALGYASCGHEPALLRRATGASVEELDPTGPVLGAFASARFAERRVAVRVGDCLAAYTDGISEAGRQRRDYLGAERLAHILQHSEGGSSAESLLHGIIAGVNQHAPGPLHDDRCLLVARFAAPPTPDAARTAAPAR